MQSLMKLVFVACLLSLPGIAFAQNADPFAAAGADDPFNETPSEGKVADGGDDPFGAGDPFGNADANDPFGSGKRRATAAQRQKIRALAASKADQNSKAKRGGDGASTTRIRAALDGMTTQTFVEYPLQDAIQQISQSHDIPILIDSRALEEIGLSSGEPINCSLKNVTLRSFLRLMLHEYELTYIIKDEVMIITTEEAAERNLIVEMYRFPTELVDKSDKILGALKSAVIPGAWDTSGGPCTASAIEDVLIVSANERIHEHVREFLVKLQVAFEKHKESR